MSVSLQFCCSDDIFSLEKKTFLESLEFELDSDFSDTNEECSTPRVTISSVLPASVSPKPVLVLSAADKGAAIAKKRLENLRPRKTPYTSNETDKKVKAVRRLYNRAKNLAAEAWATCGIASLTIIQAEDVELQPIMVPPTISDCLAKDYLTYGKYACRSVWCQSKCNRAYYTQNEQRAVQEVPVTHPLQIAEWQRIVLLMYDSTRIRPELYPLQNVLKGLSEEQLKLLAMRASEKSCT